MSQNPIYKNPEYSESLFQAITKQSGEGISLANTEGDYIFVNSAFCKMTGYSETELIKMNVRDLVPPETEVTLFPKVVKKESGSREVVLMKKNGLRFYAEIKGYPIELNDKSLVLGIVRDISQKKRYEMIIEKFFEQPMNIHLIAGFDGLIHRINNGWHTILDYFKDEIEGTNLLDLVHPEDLDSTSEEISKLKKGETMFYFENRNRHKDGSYRLLAWSAIASVKDQLIYGVASDITDQRHAEEALLLEKENLQDALAKIKKLSGMLPICSSCKKIRDDEGYWQQIESFIQDHSEAEFSHSICPDCAKKLYADMDDDNK